MPVTKTNVMSTFEYKIIKRPPPLNPDTLKDDQENLCQDGWELLLVVFDQGVWHQIFKRPLSEMMKPAA